MTNTINLQQIKRFIRLLKRIISSINNVPKEYIHIQYQEEHTFNEKHIEQYCFTVRNNHARNLNFELLLPIVKEQVNMIDINLFIEQIIYKYNVENMSSYINDSGIISTTCPINLEEHSLFKVTCLKPNHKKNSIYVKMDIESFFS